MQESIGYRQLAKWRTIGYTCTTQVVYFSSINLPQGDYINILTFVKVNFLLIWVVLQTLARVMMLSCRQIRQQTSEGNDMGCVTIVTYGNMLQLLNCMAK